MNPAIRIWACALSLCALVSICLADSDGIILFIFLLVAFASLGSLLGFYLLYALLRQLGLSRVLLWIGATLGTASIVAFNALGLLMFFEERNSLPALLRLFGDFLPIILVPMGGAIIGMLASFRKIEAYCKSPREAYYPDACI